MFERHGRTGATAATTNGPPNGLNGSDGLDGLGSLLEAVDTVPIPGAPNALPREAAAVGLSFLGTALRQNHVRRLTERLVLVEHLGAECRSEVDISLSMLDDDQWKAAQLFQSLRNRSTAAELSRPVQPRAAIWVPVSCVSRRNAAPMDVRDEAGTRLPRLTQFESSTMVAAGMYRLLTRVLTSHPDATKKTDLGRFLTSIHEARWLVRSALYAILTERAAPTVAAPRLTPEAAGGHGRQYRDLARQILIEYRPLLESYFALLNVAVNDSLLVVSLDTRRDEHLLRFDSPLTAVEGEAAAGRRLTGLPGLTGGGSPVNPRRLWHRLVGSPRNYHLEYEGEIPSNIRSYHLVAETDETIQIEKMYLITDADRETVDDLAHDLEAIAPHLEAGRNSPERGRVHRLLELELQAAIGRLGQLLRRRRWEAGLATMELDRNFGKVANSLVLADRSGESTRTDGAAVVNPLQDDPDVTPAALRTAATEILRGELYLDLAGQDEPIGQRAHTQWRRIPGKDTSGGSRTWVRAAITLSVARGVTRQTILTYIFAVVAISYGMGCLLTRSLWPFTGTGEVPVEGTSAEGAIVTLLLVPGFLYTRLDLPARNSILGYLTTRSRFLVHVCIASTAGLCASIGAELSGSAFRAMLALSVGIPLLAAVVLLRRPAAAVAAASEAGELPAWVYRTEANRLGPVDARLYSSGRRR